MTGRVTKQGSFSALPGEEGCGLIFFLQVRWLSDFREVRLPRDNVQLIKLLLIMQHNKKAALE
ncbi:hypothetical protein [Cesiribacter sp. SM1]|uniref:hypothetical protein n=1 Tax=Cesiribacter sp. SM1 TaxID=2861196 RepID=UPI001CD4A99B|nr:hypothetical protein [Cesiribacter sp. SM1]